MNKYIEEMKKMNGVERVALLTYDRLVLYYEKLGSKNHGKSAATYASVPWNDLVSVLEVANPKKTTDQYQRHEVS